METRQDFADTIVILLLILVQRLDKFMMKFIGASTKFSELWKLVKILLILSHGQAQVDREFSVNRNLLVENQHTITLTAQRIIHDHMVCRELE